MVFKQIGNHVKIVILLFVVIISCSFLSKKVSDFSETKKHAYANDNIKQLIAVLDKSILLANSKSTADRLNQLKTNYFLSRKYYKHLECLIEYCAPFDVKYFINGPLVKKSELEIGARIVDPHGFQVIEEQLFGKDSIDSKILLSELQLLKSSFIGFENKFKNLIISDAQVIESMQFELIRMSSLTLSGYDATYTKNNSAECASVFEGLKLMLNEIKKGYQINSYPTEIHLHLIAKINSAENYCSLNNDYESFNRLFFIAQHIKPIYKLLVKLHCCNLFPFTPVNYAIQLKNENLFEKEYYNLNYFSVKTNDTIGNSAQAKLGELLFFDPILSGNNQRACASCHKPNLAFTDGLQKGVSYERNNNLDRNTPTLLNTIFQKHFFYDGRARQLEQQASDVLHNQKEMNSTADEMVNRLSQSDEYKFLFKRSFIGTPDTVINFYGILKAITEYEKTLISMNSRFDKYIKGDCKQLTQQEIRGYNIFSGKALCGSCHFFPLFNGLVPPFYSDTEYEVIGVPEDANSKLVDKDVGRFAVSKSYIHQYAFKSPTIRNSNLTAPYMHNGIYKTLDDVIEFYNKGGGQGLGINSIHQTLPFDSLRLTKNEIKDIKSFVVSLADTTGLMHQPKKLPQFKDEKFNRRTIGGDY